MEPSSTSNAPNLITATNLVLSRLYDILSIVLHRCDCSPINSEAITLFSWIEKIDHSYDILKFCMWKFGKRDARLTKESKV